MTFAEVRERLAHIGWTIELTDDGKVRTARPARAELPAEQHDYESLSEAYQDTLLRNASEPEA